MTAIQPGAGWNLRRGRRARTGMKRELTVKEFVADLMARIDQAKTIDKTFAELAARKMPDEKIVVEWKDR